MRDISRSQEQRLVVTIRRLLGALVIALAISVSAPALAVSPAEESRQLAEDLLNAADETAVKDVLTAVFDRLGVPVVSSGLALGGPGFSLGNVELAIVSRTFHEGKLIPLEDIVSLWNENGVRCGAKPCQGDEVEAALRQMRLQAELQPKNPDGFVIRLIDELGNREKCPFQLLGQADQTCQGPGQYTPQVMMGEALSRQAAAARADGDEETAAAAEGLAEEGLPDFMAGMASGNMRDMLGPIMEQVAAEEGVSADDIWGDLAEAQEEMGEEEAETPEEAAMMQSAQRLLGIMQGGTLSDAVQESENLLQMQDQAMRSLQREEAKQAAESSAEARQDLSDKESDAEDVYQVGAMEVDNAISMFYTDAETAEAQRLNDLTAEELANAPNEEDRRFFQQSLTMQVPTPTSCLVLDPVQVVLVQLQLFELTSFSPEGGQY